MAELSDYKLQRMTWELCGDCTGGDLIASPADYKGRGVAVDIILCDEPLDVSEHHVYLLWRHRQARKRGTEELFSMDAAAGRKAVYWPRSMACIEGVVECQLVLSYADGGSITSRTFLVRVQEDLVGSVDPGDGFTLFVDVIKRYEDATASLLGVAEDLRREAAEGGFAGAPGKDGRDGVDGRDGADGKDGSPGPQGEPGPAGPAGADGAPGRDGVDGKPGRDGVDGKDGAPGRDGADGAPGRDGASPKVTIESGDDGSATMRVECDGVVTQATVLRGPKGDKGDPGEKGDQGEKGEPGEKGEKGDPGDGTGVSGTSITYLYGEGVFSVETDDRGIDQYVATIRATPVLKPKDIVIDRLKNFCQVMSVKLYTEADDKYPAVYEYKVKRIGSLRGVNLVFINGLNVEPGVTTDDYVPIDNQVVRDGDYLFSVDTGCLVRVEECEMYSELETGAIVTGVTRFGAPDFSAYATKEFVAEQIAASIPADLSEVSF